MRVPHGNLCKRLMRNFYRNLLKPKRTIVVILIICCPLVIVHFALLQESQGVFQESRAGMGKQLQSGTPRLSWSDQGLPKSSSCSCMIKVQAQTDSVIIQTQTDRQHEKPQMNVTNMNTENFSWKTLSATLSLFSAYYDDRHSSTDSLAILGYEMMPEKPRNLSCLVLMADGEVASVQGPAERFLIAEKWRRRIEKYRGVLYKCDLTTPGKPSYVTLVDSTSTDMKDVPFTSYVPVADVRFPEKVHKFGVCYESPLYGYKYDQEVMDSIEMNKVLGATWFTIYVYEAHAKALEILRYYSHKQKILDAVYNWGDNMVDPVHYYGQTAGVHDCVYRNMYKVRFLVLCDIDEFIMPVQGLNWNDLLPKIDRSQRVYFVFAHLGFYKNNSKAETPLRCHEERSITYKMPMFFAHHNRSGSVVVKYQQSKSIIKPRYSILVQVHRHKLMMRGYKPYFVPPDIGVMKHYRGIYHPKYTASNFTIDYNMDYFKPAVLRELERYYCGRT